MDTLVPVYIFVAVCENCPRIEVENRFCASENKYDGIGWDQSWHELICQSVMTNRKKKKFTTSTPHFTGFSTTTKRANVINYAVIIICVFFAL